MAVISCLFYHCFFGVFFFFYSSLESVSDSRYELGSLWDKCVSGTERKSCHFSLWENNIDKDRVVSRSCFHIQFLGFWLCLQVSFKVCTSALSMFIISPERHPQNVQIKSFASLTEAPLPIQTKSLEGKILCKSNCCELSWILQAAALLLDMLTTSKRQT